MAFVFDNVLRTPSLLNASSGPVIFSAITGPITPDDIDRMEASTVIVRARHTRVAAVTLVSKSTPMPDKPTRERAAAAAKRSQGGFEVIVLTSGGLWSSAARAVLTGIYLFSGKMDEHHVVTDIDEAVKIVSMHLPYDLEKTKAAATAFTALLSTSAAA